MSWVKKLRFSKACQPRATTKTTVEARATSTTSAPVVITIEPTRSFTSLKVPESRVTTTVIAIAVTNQTIRNHASPCSGRIRSQSSQVRARAPSRAPYRSKRSLALARPTAERGTDGGASSSYVGRTVRAVSLRVVITPPSRHRSGCGSR